MVARAIEPDDRARPGNGGRQVDPDADLSRLSGRTILIAESNPLIGLDLAATIAARGMVPVWYSDLKFAGKAVPVSDLAAAVVDIDVPFDQHDALIAELQSSGTPTILTTAWARDTVAARFPGFSVFEKPVHFSVLVQWFAANGLAAQGDRSRLRAQ